MIYYEVFWAKDYATEELLYCPDSANEDRIITSASLKLPINDGSEFTFQIHRDHPLYDDITPFVGVVIVYETANSGERKVKFRGRIVKVTYDYKMSKTVTAQGGLYWLKWSQYARYINNYPQAILDAGLDMQKLSELREKYFPIRKFQKSTTIPEMVDYILTCHNWQMRTNSGDNLGQFEYPSDTRYPGTFQLGICLARENPYGVDVKNKDETQSEGVYITRDNSNLTTPYDWFRTELIEKTCCNVVVDEETGVIDIYGEIVPTDDTQTVTLERNIIDFAKSDNFTNLCTVFLPVGKSVSSHGTMLSKTATTGDIALDSDSSAYVVTTIADTGEEGTTVDQDPIAYVTTYSSDLDGTAATAIDEDNPPTYGTDILKIISKTNRVLVATEDEFPGGITFYLEPPFIVWAEGVERYGRIVGQKQWGSATRTQLRAYGPSYFKRLILSTEEIEINAVDLAYIDTDVPSAISLARRYRVVSQLHNVDEYIPCQEITIDILNAANTKYTFKKSRKPFTLLVKGLKDRLAQEESKSFNPPRHLARSLLDGRITEIE